jgi:hypothetical protein
MLLPKGTFFAALLAAGIALAWPAQGAETNAAPAPAELPTQGVLARMAALERKVGPLEAKLAPALKARQWDEAEKICRQMVQEAPFYPHSYYNLACLMAIKGQTNEAFAFLDDAIAKGYNNPEHLRNDADLAALRADERFAKVIERAQTAKPPAVREAHATVVTNHIAWVSDSNTALVQGIYRAVFQLDRTEAARQGICNLRSEAGDRLRRWWTNGTAAGNVGDLYDNRDADHSNLDPWNFPQLTYVEYGPEAVSLKLHWGVAEHLVINGGVVVGNASVAATSGAYWRSMTRAAYTSGQTLGLLQLQYFGNQLYLYPSHHDYMVGHNGKTPDGRAGGYGDVYPANAPYTITSLGSSGSDQAFLQAVMATLAAFRPEVKKLLVEKGMLMPTVQYIFRASNRQVARPEDYLTGPAHPPVFDAQHLNVLKMVEMAQAMTRETTPPMAILKVVEEDRPAPGRDLFDSVATEELFTTPCAVARVMRSTQYRRRMVISLESSGDLNNRPLKYHCVVLQGDAEAIRIKPLNEAGTRFELSVPWQGRRPVRPDAMLDSNRIDIGVFAHNGIHYSPPSFVTWYCPDNEDRVYGRNDRIQAVTYTGADESGNYVDPMVQLAKSWKDEYHYDQDGALTGWTRRRGAKTEEFTPAGELIIARSEDGRPLKTRPVRYAPHPRGTSQPMVVEEVVDEPPPVRVPFRAK